MELIIYGRVVLMRSLNRRIIHIGLAKYPLARTASGYSASLGILGENVHYNLFHHSSPKPIVSIIYTQ